MVQAPAKARPPRFANPWREAFWLLAFLLLVAAAVVTVALPELGKDPDSEPRGQAATPTP